MRQADTGIFYNEIVLELPMAEIDDNLRSGCLRKLEKVTTQKLVGTGPGTLAPASRSLTCVLATSTGRDSPHFIQLTVRFYHSEWNRSPLTMIDFALAWVLAVVSCIFSLANT